MSPTLLTPARRVVSRAVVLPFGGSCGPSTVGDVAHATVAAVAPCGVLPGKRVPPAPPWRPRTVASSAEGDGRAVDQAGPGFPAERYLYYIDIFYQYVCVYHIYIHIL